jgi:hypothetical protein
MFLIRGKLFAVKENSDKKSGGYFYFYSYFRQKG